MRGCWSIGVGVGLVTMLAAAPSLAAGSGVLVSVPRVEGQAPGNLVETLAAAAAEGLADAGAEVAGSPAGCADDACMAAEVAAGNARAYVSTEVQVTGSDYALVVELLDGAGTSLRREEGTCEICSLEEVASAVRGLVTKAAEGLEPPAPAAGTVSVVSDPPGATVLIDGTPVGTTPYEGSIDQGAHALELTLDGRESAQQRLEVIAGETSSVDLALARQARISPRTTEIIGWSAVGLGAALLAGGITMLVLDENPVRSNCSGVHVDGDGDCEFRYDTLGGGIGLTVAGVLVIGGGVGLAIISRKKRAARGSAEVALVPGGVRARF